MAVDIKLIFFSRFGRRRVPEQIKILPGHGKSDQGSQVRSGKQYTVKREGLILLSPLF
jgi:hypothetical protein